ncbi:hypothetical protein Pelo_17046 [Pelomyxa schiedti]|nr:hypothetical protein Pelo_17046 [Pelomyxa schiedti]
MQHRKAPATPKARSAADRTATTAKCAVPDDAKADTVTTTTTTTTADDENERKKKQLAELQNAADQKIPLANIFPELVKLDKKGTVCKKFFIFTLLMFAVPLLTMLVCTLALIKFNGQEAADAVIWGGAAAVCATLIVQLLYVITAVKESASEN